MMIDLSGNNAYFEKYTCITENELKMIKQKIKEEFLIWLAYCMLVTWKCTFT